MAIAITVPRLGWSMDEGTFAGWLKQDGDRITPGDTIFVLESDKATEQIESLDGGILRIPPDGPKHGDSVKVGQVLAYLTAEGEAVPFVPTAREVKRTVDPMSQPRQTSTILREPGPRSRPAITPRARRAARKLDIDWTNLRGTGSRGRIRERDVQALAKDGQEAALTPHSPVRRTIAARMIAGVTQAAPVTLTTKADAANLVNLRSQFKAAATSPDTIVPTYTDLFVKLTAAALSKHPLLLAQWHDAGLLRLNCIDIGISVDTDAGLFAPVIRKADKLTLAQVALRARELITRARAGELTAEEMRDATFTVTNLGGLGIDAFTPIIQLPQCAVLGVGRIAREVTVLDDKVVPREVTTLSLTFDHRVLDGAPAARFLKTLRSYLENPASWLML